MKASDTASPQGRSSDVPREEIIIVGAGQAGLSMGYWLKRQQRSFLLLEAERRIGESWRQRYDSLVLFTPRRYSALPGLAFPGDPKGRPTKDEMADYLQTYVGHFALPIQMDTRVVGMHKHGETFMLQTTPRATSAQGNTVQFADGSQAQVRTVIWATGYRQDFSWLRLPGALDESGQPIRHQGVSSIGRLFFLGFPWQPSRGSALVGWVGKDARRLAALLQTKERVLG